MCKFCNSHDKLTFNNFISGYASFCMPKCASDWYRENETKEQNKTKGLKISKSLKTKSKNEWEKIKQKREQTKLKKYGNKDYNNPSKYKKTMLEKYGVIIPLQIPEINKKFKNTLKNKDWTEANNSRKETLMKTTGFEHQLQNPSTKEKVKKTCLKRYGVENPSQDPGIAEKKVKSSYRKKEYRLPNGDITLVQGYENFVLDKLFQTFSTHEIVINPVEMPEIWYIEDGERHRYFPDIFIPAENKIIEVKSTRTMNLQLKKNLLKQARCLEMGFNFEFIIFDNKMNLVDEKEFL